MLLAFLELFSVILCSWPAYMLNFFINYQMQLYLAIPYMEIYVYPAPIWKHYQFLNIE